MAEVAEVRAQLAEVVDEVLFLEGQLSARQREVAFLRQSLADSTAAHASAIRALQEGLSDGPEAAAALEDLGNFQQKLQRLLVEANLQLPKPNFMPVARAKRISNSNGSFHSLNSVNSSGSWRNDAQERKNKPMVREFGKQLSEAKIWTLKDDGGSEQDSFGMSSNTQPASEVSRLKQLLRDQEQQHERQRKALLKQAETELRDAEAEIQRLKKKERNGLPSPRSDSRSLTVRDDFRMTQLEEELAKQKRENERLRREVKAASRDKGEAMNAFEELELEHTLGQEAFETEKSQRKRLREELDKAHRDREISLREVRAAERRHSALVDEMKQVMEERDAANSKTDEANRKFLSGLQELETLRTDLDEAMQERDAAESGRERAEKELNVVRRSLEAEKQKMSEIQQDLIIAEQQSETVAMERDAAVREQQNSMERLDRALSDRRQAFAARDEALQSSSSLENEAARLRVQEHKDQKIIKQLQDELNRGNERLEKSLQRISEAERKEREARSAAEEADEAKMSAEQEMEVSQRQANALREELKSVLRVRDIALRQRDVAIQEKQSRSKSNDLALLDASRGDADHAEHLEAWLKKKLLDIGHRMRDVHQILQEAHLKSVEGFEGLSGNDFSSPRTVSPRHSDREDRIVAFMEECVVLLETDASKYTKSILKFANAVQSKEARVSLLESKIDEITRSSEFENDAGKPSADMFAALEKEREQLREALDRLRRSDAQVTELKRKLRSKHFDIERLEAERDRLLHNVETASSQLKGVANQKTSAAKELEEVYVSLTELEKQLFASHAENARLQQILAAHGPPNGKRK